MGCGAGEGHDGPRIELMFDRLAGWVGTTGRRAGRRWSGCSTASRAAPGWPHRSSGSATAATARPGHASAGATQPAVGQAPGCARRCPYAELHAHSAYSFLDGASTPEELVEEAARLGSAGHRADRPRRALRRGAVRRGGQGARHAHGVRCRTVARRRRPHRRSPTRPGRTCWCWPAGRRGTGGCRASWRPRIWPAARRATRATTSTRSPRPPAGTGTS